MEAAANSLEGDLIELAVKEETITPSSYQPVVACGGANIQICCGV
jgi:hypothetical protein